MSITGDIAWLQTVFLVAVRMYAFFSIAPPFSFSSFPKRTKWVMALAIGMLTAQKINMPPHLTAPTYMLSIVSEIATGMAFGFIVAVIFSAIQGAGAFIDMVGGFAMASSFDPATQSSGAFVSRIFNIAGIALLFTTGGYLIMVAGAVRTFDVVPVGVFVSLEHYAPSLVTFFSQAFIAVVQIAGPLVVILFLADIGLGLLTRVAPAMNPFALAFPLKVFITILLVGTIVASLPHTVRAFTDLVATNVLGVK